MIARSNILIVLLASVLMSCAQNGSHVRWSFSTGGKILSHPIVDDGLVFFGSNDSSFYALETGSGDLRWEYTTRSEIRGTALVHGDVVYVASGNDLYALRKSTGEEIWAFRNTESSGGEQIDLWDYHTGGPVIHDSTVYVGSGDGYVRGFDTASGTLRSAFATADTVPVRSGLVVENSNLYFGDWNGKLYAYDVNSGQRLWTYASYEERLYPTFGQITAQLAIAGDLLIFGARNPELQVIDKRTGKKRWSYVEKDGGWISGDPLIVGDTLYIGGSDNHEMFAFNVNTGEHYWTYTFLTNNFSRPVIYNDVLLFTIGDAYTVYGTGTGRGYLYALNKSDGSLRSITVVGGNTHSTPALQDDMLFVGSEDGHLYAFDAKALVNAPFEKQDIGYEAATISEITPNPLTEESMIHYTVAYASPITVSITDLSDSTITVLTSASMDPGEYSVRWDGKDSSGQDREDGYYFVKVSSKKYSTTAFVQVKRGQ